MKLAFDLAFEDLYSADGVRRIDGLFLDHLRASDEALHQRLTAARAAGGGLPAKEASDLLVETAPHVEDFVAALFGVEKEVRDLAAATDALAPVQVCRRMFVQRRAAKAYGADEAAEFDGAALEADLEAAIGRPVDELSFAERVNAWGEAADDHEAELDLAARYAAWAIHTDAGRARWPESTLFRVPAKISPDALVHAESASLGELQVIRADEESIRRRDGFGLTDAGMDLSQALYHANYCIWCHNQGKDSCSKGMTVKGSEEFRDDAFGQPLAGCPLEEKISEMNLVKARGQAIGALAIVTVDNPLCAATGHRICNDCMKACIYQKQEPVDIPQVETRTLKDVLELPWGFEIYGLLTRWTPLDFRRPVPRAESGYKVLVVGLGPAGFNLAHHLLNDGHTVVGVDGLKIEPLPADISGVDPLGNRVPFRPIERIAELRETLDDRTMAGFGGVAEYGITVRWDKNFLKIIRLLLERRARYAMFGGVRFGGTITIEGAMAMGFDHIALCAGAGRPTIIDIPNSLAKGARMASDFLMALQLTGAAKDSSVANLQLRLPVVVIGGGLTAVDAATEALAYYPRQVEKFLQRYETLVAMSGESSEAAVRRGWTEEEEKTADEFIAHGTAIRQERATAAAEGRAPAILELLNRWGGVTLAYRRRLVDAPSYTGNHEEVSKALEEGIRFAERLSPRSIDIDEYGHVAAIRMTVMAVSEDGKLTPSNEEITLDAKTILVAAGTQPNTVIAREDPANVPPLDGRYFQAFDPAGQPTTPERSAKPKEPAVFMSFLADGRAMSFWGDLHPSFAGNVVKAMGGAKQGYPTVTQQMASRPAEAPSGAELITDLNRDLRPTVREVIRHTGNIVELVIHAPAQAESFRPGQFFRLQNFETLAPRVDGTCLSMEGLALTGAWVDTEQGLISTIVLEMGGSSSLCHLLKPGEPVVLMGPTGTPTDVPGGETVLLAGGGLGNAVLFSIGQALRQAGSRVLYFAGYKGLEDRYHVESIERAADVIVWCCDAAPGFTAARPQDKSFVGNIVEAMKAYAGGDLGSADIRLGDVDRMIVIGSDRMMAAVAAARKDGLRHHLKPGHIGIGSINSPMQCMMKEICAQCLQRHRHPVTGEERIVFSCFNQDQNLDHVDFAHLRTRLSQNAAQEKISSQWIDHCLQRMSVTETGDGTGTSDAPPTA